MYLLGEEICTSIVLVCSTMMLTSLHESYTITLLNFTIQVSCGWKHTAAISGKDCFEIEFQCSVIVIYWKTGMVESWGYNCDIYLYCFREIHFYIWKKFLLCISRIETNPCLVGLGKRRKDIGTLVRPNKRIPMFVSKNSSRSWNLGFQLDQLI